MFVFIVSGWNRGSSKCYHPASRTWYQSTNGWIWWESDLWAEAATDRLVCIT